jgi:glycosyltransferase involved in cell wall biosynthesis
VLDRIRFAGPIYGPDKWRLLRQARCLVLPSISENFGNAVLEALAIGCPVVVSPTVGLAELVSREACGVVAESDAGSLGRALSELWTDDGARQVMGKNGMAAVRSHYVWERVATRVETFYSGILSAARP